MGRIGYITINYLKFKGVIIMIDKWRVNL